MKKPLYFLLVLTLGQVFGQITISEVYYDTPVDESYRYSPDSHAREFIELFNFSNVVIDISGWRISDNNGIVVFPTNTLINPGDFYIVRRNIPNYIVNGEDYFFNMFPNIDLELNRNKIIGHNFRLSNSSDEVYLYGNHLNGQEFENEILISTFEYDCSLSSQISCNLSPYNSGTLVNGQINYSYNYYRKSANRNVENFSQVNFVANQGLYYRTATPFEKDFEFELVDLSEIPHLQPYVILDNCFDNSTGQVDLVLNQSCNHNVPVINDASFTDDELAYYCFSYDAAGNQTGKVLCINIEDPETTSENENEEDQTNWASYFYLAPNPTSGLITLGWQPEVNNLMSEIYIISLNGAYQIPIGFQANSGSVMIDLSTYPPGQYVAKFILNNGVVVNKQITRSI
ncbi:MAG: lamin tail domain-containing protein [Flavobacteriaceae bacterium]|nr:lamin tail domain-containing protein [Flavobacteriaceae bacterium]